MNEKLRTWIKIEKKNTRAKAKDQKEDEREKKNIRNSNTPLSYGVENEKTKK